MKQYIVEFSSEWVLSKRDEGILPGEVVADYLKNRDLKLEEKSFTEVAAVGEADAFQSEEAFRKMIFDLLKEKFPNDAGKLEDVVKCRMEETQKEEEPGEEEQKKEDPKDQETSRKEEKKPEKKSAGGKKKEESLPDVHDLLGVEELVGFCDRVRSLAPVLKDHDGDYLLREQVVLLSVDPGEGMTTALKILQKEYNEAGVFALKGKPVEILLPSFNEEDPGEFLSARKAICQAEGRLLGIDISNWLEELSSVEFRDFLVELHHSLGKAAIVLCVPGLDEETLSGIRAAIGDVLRLACIAIPAHSTEQLKEAAKRRFSEHSFTIADSAWKVFEEKLSEEKSDGRFYGFRTVNKVSDDMMLQKALSSALEGKDDNTIREEDLTGFVRFTESKKSAEDELKELVGMEEIRDQLFEIVSQIEYAASHAGELERPGMHMRFVGAPGTGKTTVARIVGKLLREKGLLSKGAFFEYVGGDLMGRFVGHTSPKVKAICRDAYGSVLFIDEAYTLLSSGYGRSYSDEAVEALLAQMENHRKDFVVILAGYEKEIDELVAQNPGLESRVPHVVKFPNYSRELLWEIFQSFAAHSPFRMESQAMESAERYFKELPKEIYQGETFANARFVRNLFERTWRKSIRRFRDSGAEEAVITAEDFFAASKAEKEDLNRKKKASGQTVSFGFAPAGV